MMTEYESKAGEKAKRLESENAKLLTIAERVIEERNLLRDENAKLRAALALANQPEGHREERVAAWLRKHGYTVTKNV